ncbi:MAG: hypothetical protein ACOH5I_22350 [Oligoflexus sp.]
MKIFAAYCIFFSILSFMLEIIPELPYSIDDTPGPFPPIVEQLSKTNVELVAKLQDMAILPKTIRIAPSILELKPGAKSPPIHAFFESNGEEVGVDFEIIAPHLHESEKGYVSENGELSVSKGLTGKTEFIVRARLKNYADIYDDLIVLIRP